MYLVMRRKKIKVGSFLCFVVFFLQTTKRAMFEISEKGNDTCCFVSLSWESLSLVLQLGSLPR